MGQNCIKAREGKSDSTDGINQVKNGKSTKHRLVANDGDAGEKLELEIKHESDAILLSNNVKDAWTMTDQPSKLDTATSPPSIFSHPLHYAPNEDTYEIKGKEDSKESLMRKRIISADPVGTFVGGYGSYPTGLEITADELDTARKRLRRNSCDSNYNSMPKMPVVLEFDEDQDEVMITEPVKLTKVSDEKVNGSASISSILQSKEPEYFNPELTVVKSSISATSSSSEVDLDDVFVTNRNRKKETIHIELLAEASQRHSMSEMPNASEFHENQNVAMITKPVKLTQVSDELENCSTSTSSIQQNKELENVNQKPSVTKSPILASSSSSEVDSDDVLVPNNDRKKDVIYVELHEEAFQHHSMSEMPNVWEFHKNQDVAMITKPVRLTQGSDELENCSPSNSSIEQNKLLENFNLKLPVTKSSNTSSTEEELLDRFYSKCEIYKRCGLEDGYKLIEQRKGELQGNNALHGVNLPEFRPQLPSTSPPRPNESDLSVTTKFTSLNIDDSIEDQ